MQDCWVTWPASIKKIDIESHPTGQKKRLETLSFLRLTDRFVAQDSLPRVSHPYGTPPGPASIKKIDIESHPTGQKKRLETLYN